MPKISELTELLAAGLDDADVLPVVDADATPDPITKKVTLATLRSKLLGLLPDLPAGSLADEDLLYVWDTSASQLVRVLWSDLAAQVAELFPVQIVAAGRVNFTGTATDLITATGVSGATRPAAGQRRLTFTTEQPDANYIVICTNGAGSGYTVGVQNLTTTTFDLVQNEAGSCHFVVYRVN